MPTPTRENVQRVLSIFADNWDYMAPLGDAFLDDVPGWAEKVAARHEKDPVKYPLASKQQVRGLVVKGIAFSKLRKVVKGATSFDEGIHETAAPQPLDEDDLFCPTEDEIDDVCDRLGPRASSITRRLLNGDTLEKIADDLGTSRKSVYGIFQKELQR